MLQPLIIGRAVRLTPPATMVAALVGVAAGGAIGGLLAIPMLGASKAIYLALRSPIELGDAGGGLGAAERASAAVRFG